MHPRFWFKVVVDLNGAYTVRVLFDMYCLQLLLTTAGISYNPQTEQHERANATLCN